MVMTSAEFCGENYYKHPPLTSEMLAYAENFLGVKLPGLLVELLRVQNGGYTKEFGFPMSVRTSWAKDHVPMDELFGIVPRGVRTAHNMVDPELLEVNSAYLPPKQVLLTGDGHWWITLDYRLRDEPGVLWADVEMDEYLPIAPTFEAFYAELRPTSEFAPDEFEEIEIKL